MLQQLIACLASFVIVGDAKACTKQESRYPWLYSMVSPFFNLGRMLFRQASKISGKNVSKIHIANGCKA